MKKRDDIWTALAFGMIIFFFAVTCAYNKKSAYLNINAYGGIKLIHIKPGTFLMGKSYGEYDETPVHKVTMRNPFYISSDLISFEQYEDFCPDFRNSLKIINRINLNNKVDTVPEYEGELADTDPVVGITWYNAVSFCEWLNKKENRPLKDGLKYRLPTEAEWEYAVRMDSSGRLNLNGMLGNVEQWILDWYGPYLNKQFINPAGYKSGTHKVTRGGCELTLKESIRPTNRMSFLPSDRYSKLGFRIVLGKKVSNFIKEQPIPLCQQNVMQNNYDWITHLVSADTPVFIPPIEFVKIPLGSNGPLFSTHNHFPSITWCPNGDLLATWYSCLTEGGTQLNIASSRLRYGKDEWEQASLFWSGADRNDHSTAIWTDENTGRLFHFQGAGSFPNQINQILVMRTSDDNGATWTDPKIINNVRSMWNPHVVLKTHDGTIVITSDLSYNKPLWGRIILSRDYGKTWHVPEGIILGQHSGIVELNDGTLMTVGRDNWDTDHPACCGIGVPISESKDIGKTWTYRREPSLGRGISTRQRQVLIRLREGPILYIGFTDMMNSSNPIGIEVVDADGKHRIVYGMFSALSFDEGKTWSYHKLLTPGAETKEYDGGAKTRKFIADASHAEPAGYIQAVQTLDGMIHLISSKLHYRFNLAWLKTPTIRIN